MSGTRKMEKFEVDAFTGRRVDDRREPPDPAAPPADTGLPARPFEPRTTPLEARPFEPRPEGALPPPDPGDTAPATPVTAAAAAAIMAAVQDGPGEWVPPQAPGAGEDGRTSDLEVLRTRLTRKFVSLAESVTESFREFAIGGGAWSVELTAPQGMSTGGGKQALQHLRLNPRKPGYSVLVAGTVNPMERRAELRDFDHIAIMHEVRFRHRLEISTQEWEQFLRKAEVVLNGAGIQSMRTPPPRDLLEQRRSLQRVSKPAVLALVVVLLLAAIVVWRVVVTLMRT